MVHPAPGTVPALHDSPIAIVGLGALYPKSRDLKEFWSNIVDATDCIEDVPATHWRIEDHYDPDPAAPDKTYAKRGGFIPTVDFDPVEFGLPPNQLDVTDVLQLLSLVVAKQTLADAGAPGSAWYDPARTGVVLGITGANSLTQPLATRLQTPVLKEVVRSCGLTDVDAEQIAAKFVKAFAPWEENSFPGMLGNVVAGRIANRFDLGGTNCTVDAACASSLAAVHLAVLELVSGRADLMITGGCDAENTILMYLCFSKTPAFSRSGVIRPFDDASDGTLIGEGMGMLALKRLADAERDGDRIYAVIQGIGTSSDGRYKSIYAPRREGQVVALDRAYRDAGFGPETVGLVECHGTGTPVGDLTELTALRDVYSAATADTRFCAVGSVKSQIGHTKAAAGAAAMIKVALALHHQVLPPTINVDKPRAAVDFDSSPFYVNTRTRPWLVDRERPERRAALSSFGFGGTNYHCVLAEHAATATQPALHRTAQVRSWHAPTVDELITAVRSQPDGSPESTIPPTAPRLAVVGRSDAELARSAATAADRLAADPAADAFELPGIYYRRSAATERKLAALFAGQGSQYVGMGSATAVALPPVRAEFDAAALASAADEPLNRVVFPPPAFDPDVAAAQEARLRRTEFAQPAIGALSAGQFRWLAELGLAVDGTLGHSFGELTALWAAGSLTDADFRMLATARGRAMAARPGDHDRGTMAAVGCSVDDAIRLAAGSPGIAICNLNAPRQIVVGGPEPVVRSFVAAAGRDGYSATLLPVDAAFHTAAMAPYVTGFAAAAERAQIRPPAVPVYPNTHDAAYGADPDANRRVLVGQLTRPVHFADRLQQMYRDGYRIFVEFGPRSVLTGLVWQTLGQHPDVIALSADAGPGRDGDVALKQLAARLLVLGVPLDRVNRYAAPAPQEPARRGMRIPLNGINHVSERRRREYADAIENGYRVPTAAASPAPNDLSSIEPSPVEPSPAEPSPAELPADGRITRPDIQEEKHTMSPLIAESPPQVATPVPAATPRPAPVPSPSPADAVDWLTLHHLFLVGQQQLTDRLTGLLAAPDGGALTAAAAQAIVAVAGHGEAVARSHGLALRALHPAGPAPDQPDHEIFSATVIPAVTPAVIPTVEPVPLTAPASLPASVAPVAAPNPPAPVAAAPSVAAPSVAAPVASAPTVAAAPSPAPVPTANPTPTPIASGQRAQIQQALLDIVSAKTGYPTDMLDIGMDVEADLGIDSIKRVEILGALHDQFPHAPSAGPEQLGELRTLLDIVTFLNGGPAGIAPNDAPTAPTGSAPVFTAPVEAPAAAPVAHAPVPAAPAPTVAAAPSPAPVPTAVPTANPTANPTPTPTASGQRAQIQQALLDIVSAKTGYPTDMLDIGMDVEADLGIDSIKRVEILGALHDQFPHAPSAGPEQLGELRTLLDIVTFLDGGPATVPADGEVSFPKADGAPQIARMQARLTSIPAADRLIGGYRGTPTALVAGHRPALADRLAQLLRADGWTVHLGGELATGPDRLDLVVYLAPREVADPAAAQDVLTDALLLAGRTIGRLQDDPTGRTAFVTVSALDGTIGMTAPQGPTALLGGLAGLTKTLGIEAPSVFSRAVDLDPTLSDDRSAELLLAELHDPEFTLRQVGVAADGRRRTIELVPDRPVGPATAVPEPGPDDLILVTGGGRGITAACAAALAERFGCGLLLAGRTRLIDEPSWLADLPVVQWRSAIAADLRAAGARPTPRDVERRCRELLAAREVRELLVDLAGRGVRADYLAVDVTDPAATALALAPHRSRITGLVHGAGVLADQIVVDKREADVRRVLGAKLTGLTSVLDAIDGTGLRHVVLFSSVAGFFGNRGQADYAMANEGLNRMAVALRRRLPGSRVTAINWGAWAGGMVTPALERMFADRGVPLIPLPVGVAMFVEQFTAARGADVVCVIGPDTPLSVAEAGERRPLRIRRPIGPLLADPASADHALGGHPVLPAVVAVGCMLNLAGRAQPGPARLIAGFQVLKGVVADGSEPAALDWVLTPVDGGTDVLATDPAGRPRYRATIGDRLPEPASRAVPAPTTGDPAGCYRDGALFHGPSWQGLRNLLTDDGSGLVMTCRRPAGGFADPAARRPDFDPAIADQLLQLALVAHHRRSGITSLPTGIASIELHRTPADDEEFLVVAEPAGPTDRPTVRYDVTACRPDGRVLLRFTGVELVPSPALSAMFPAAA